RSWLDDCNKSHPQCSLSSNPPQLPTRLLDLHASEDTVRLIDTRGTKVIPYIALSYCWGNDSLPLTLSETTLPQNHQIASFPPSFQDAIRLTRALNIRYLWIDSLCILQDCIPDWESESSKMLQYYSGAFLVLAASRAASPASGFLRARDACEVVQQRYFPNAAGEGVTARRFSQHLTFDLNCGSAKCAPLDTRAWALQERLSARRIVHFYDAEMIWECEAGAKCECGKLSEGNRLLENGILPLKMRMAQGVAAGKKSPEEGFRAWAGLVEHYTRCNLTQDDDRLPAIGGLARMFSTEGRQGRYVAGMWERTLLPCILWRVGDSVNARRARTYVAPSWSWAGVVGQVDW
ncbi:heterokaryon incompatibility protein-domain-containing protein, partial [Cercophora newfieldiana]